MSYSTDIREAALRCVAEGKRHTEIVEFFKISLKTLSNWIRLQREQGTIQVAKRKEYRKQKVDKEQLLKMVEERPDATLEELAKPFNVYPSTVDYHLRKLGVTRKKNHALSGARRGKKTKVLIRNRNT